MVNSSKTQILHYCFHHHIVWFPVTFIQYITIKPKISEVRDTKNQIITVCCVCTCVCARACLVIQLCPIMWPWAVAHQAPLLMGFLRQEYWRVLPFSSSGDLPNPGVEHVSLLPPALQADSLPAEPSITLGRLPNHSLGLGLFHQLSNPDDDITVLLHRF